LAEFDLDLGDLDVDHRDVPIPMTTPDGETVEGVGRFEHG
jgi:hypothetical protein